MEENKVDMYKLLQKVPPIHWLYMRIAEPRVVRILYFGIYLCMGVAGTVLVSVPPEQYEDVIGLVLVYILGSFILLGGLFSAVAVLPGVWWLERVGIILLATAMLIYVVIVLSLKGSIIGVAVPIAFMLTFAIRWIDIRKYQLAPTKITSVRKE